MATYKLTMTVRAEEIPVLFEMWLMNELPVDFTVSGTKSNGMREVVITVKGNDLAAIMAKQTAVIKVIRSGGVRGTITNDWQRTA